MLPTAEEIGQLQLDPEDRHTSVAYLHCASLANCGRASAEMATPSIKIKRLTESFVVDYLINFN